MAIDRKGVEILLYSALQSLADARSQLVKLSETYESEMALYAIADAERKIVEARQS